MPALSLPAGHERPTLAQLREAEAVALFVDRASRAAEFESKYEALRDVAAICERVDGVPLAIELAAARTRVLAAGQIRARLEADLGILRSDERTRPERHKTLAATIDWSVRLLSAAEMTLLRRLSVFRGGFDLRAAEAVCTGGGYAAGRRDGRDGREAEDAASPAHRSVAIERDEVIDLVARLIDASLLATERAGDGLRYRMLGVVRAPVHALLVAAGEDGAMAERHARHMVARATEAEEPLQGPEQAAWMDRLEADEANLRAAMAWLLEHGEVEAGLRLAKGVFRFWYFRGRHGLEREWLGELLASTGDAPDAALVAEGHRMLGSLAYHRALYDDARDHYEDAVRGYQSVGDVLAAARVLSMLGRVHVVVGEYEDAGEACAAALDVQRQHGTGWGVAHALNSLADVNMRLGELVRAREFFEESLAIHDQHGERGASILNQFRGLAYIAQIQGEYAAARAFVERGMMLSRELGFDRGVAGWRSMLGGVANDEGEYREARHLLEAAVSTYRGMAEDEDLARALNNLAEVDMREGHWAAARLRLHRSLALKEKTGDAWSALLTLANLAEIDARQGMLDKAQSIVDRLFRDRESMRDVVLEAHVCRVAALVRLEADEPRTVGPHLKRAITIERQLRARRGLACTWELLAEAAVAVGLDRHARLLLTAADRVRATSGARRGFAVAERVEGLRRQLRPAGGGESKDRKALKDSDLDEASVLATEAAVVRALSRP